MHVFKKKLKKNLSRFNYSFEELKSKAFMGKIKF